MTACNVYKLQHCRTLADSFLLQFCPSVGLCLSWIDCIDQSEHSITGHLTVLTNQITALPYTWLYWLITLQYCDHVWVEMDRAFYRGEAETEEIVPSVRHEWSGQIWQWFPHAKTVLTNHNTARFRQLLTNHQVHWHWPRWEGLQLQTERGWRLGVQFSKEWNHLDSGFSCKNSSVDFLIVNELGASLDACQ